MKGYFVTILFSVIFSFATYCQSAFLQKGVSGLSIGTDISYNEDYIGLSGGLGYSILGKFDIGLSVNGTFYDEIYGRNIHSISYIPDITYFILKQQGRVPISLSIGANFHFANYGGDAMDYSGLEMINYGFSFGANIYRLLKINSNFKIQPDIGPSYSFSKQRVEGKYVGTNYSTSDGVSLGIGLPFIFGDCPKNIFIVSPKIGLYFNLSDAYRFVYKNITPGLAIIYIFTVKEE